MTADETVNTSPVDAPESERMRKLINTISSYIEHYHGGAVEFVSYDGAVVNVRLLGACEGCDLAEVTLHGWVEGTVRQFFPDIETVTAV
mgnify:CR=1 FL=1